MNAKMPELKHGFERAGFTAVKTVLASGNVVFDSTLRSVAELERQAEAALQKHLGRTFYTIVRSVDALQEMLETDPFSSFQLSAEAKRVVTFSRALGKPAKPLPIELDGARILSATAREAFSAYVPGPRGPVFMALIEQTFGKDVTTRTWETVKKCVRA